MKNRLALNLFLAATLLSMAFLAVTIPFVRAIEWSAENPLTADPYQDKSPAIMQAENGTIWVVWASNRIEFLNYELFCRTSSDYGWSWSPDMRLTWDNETDWGPSIAQASDGTIWVVWHSDRTGNADIFYKVYNSSQVDPWSPETGLTTDPNDDRSPSIMRANDGKLWVVWSSNRTGNYDLFYKTYNGTAWSSYTQQLTTDSNLDLNPSIMQAGDGTIWVVWSSYRTGNYDLFYKTYNGTAWSSYPPLTDDLDFDRLPSIVQARNGTIWVVWQSDRQSTFGDDLYYKVYDGSVWSSDTRLTSDHAEDVTSSIAQIYDRKIWILWAADRDDDFDIYYKTTVAIPGDVNCDETVDITDLTIIGETYGTAQGDADYDPYADLNCNGVIDIYDLAECSKNYG